MDGRSLGRVVAVAANTYRESVRERVLYNLVFFAILMTLSGLLVRQLSIRQDAKIIKDIGLASMDIFGTLIAMFIGVGLVSKEIERRSIVPLLAKPVSREEFYCGKFLGLESFNRFPAGLVFRLKSFFQFVEVGTHAKSMTLASRTVSNAMPNRLRAPCPNTQPPGEFTFFSNPGQT